MVRESRVYVFTMAIIASLSGIVLGYDATVISGAIEPLSQYFSLTPAMSGWAVSNVILGCVVGAYLAGSIADRIGRKMALLVTAVLFSVSAIGSALATIFWVFVLFRLVGGLAVGIASAVTQPKASCQREGTTAM